MKNNIIPKKIKIKSLCLFIITFLFINSLAHIQVLTHKKQEELKAEYTVDTTIGRISAQINRYQSKSEMLRKIIESEGEISDEEFNDISKMMQDESGIIDGIELAKDGIVSQVYPYEPNKEAMGLNMLEYEARKAEANLAKQSEKYTIAGPFELVQGGMGALLFEPIYVNTANEENKFWGFSILVINWDKFIESIDLGQLEKASYCYKITKKDLTTGNRIVIAKGSKNTIKDTIEVACDMPNDTWYFEIVPKEGWFSRIQLVINSLLCLLVSLLVTITYWQSMARRYRESIYTLKIKKTADDAKAANLAKTSFLSRMSHDIRTPLNGIIGLLEIDANHPDDRQLVDDNRKKMMVASNHLLALINDVLQMSKLESGELVLAHEPMNLAKISTEILTILAQRAAEEGITLEYDPASSKLDVAYVYGSPLHLRQIFLNIYGNCIKYNHIGGKVRTNLTKLLQTEDTVTYRWTISDNGIGMSEEFVKHIFEPFAQEHSDARSVYQGTGLGMAIVKALINEMNGSIKVKSKEGEGSTFIITIPFEIAHIDEQEMLEKNNNLKSIKGLNILLAEDNTLNAEIAQMLLNDEGVKVTVVQNGQEAIDAFANNKPGTFDMILMDIMMPIKDGITATKEIRAMERKDAKDIPIIAMTANAFDEDAKKCIEAGMNAHLSKPLDMKKVIETMSSFS